MSGTGNEGHLVAMTTAQAGHVICNNTMKKSCVRDHFLWCYFWEQKCAKALTKAVNQMDCGRDKYTNTSLAVNSKGIQNKLEQPKKKNCNMCRESKGNK